MRSIRCAGGKPLLALLCFIAILVPAGARAESETDSAAVRTVEPPDKSPGDVLLDIPEEVLKAPVRVVGLVTRGVIQAIFGNRTLYELASGLLSLEPTDGFYPVVGYGVNSGLAGGPGYRRFGLFTAGDGLFVSGSYSTHDYQRYRLRYRTPRLFGRNLGTHFVAQYRKRPRESFFGSGNSSLEGNEVSFTLEETHLANTLTWRVSSSVDLGFLTAFTKLNLYDGRDPDLPGDLDVVRDTLNLTQADLRRTEFLTAGVTLRHDWRDHPGQPSSGGVEEITVLYNRGTRFSDDLDFAKTKIEVQHFLNLFKKRILALRVMAQDISRRSGASPLPFYLQSTLGGDQYLRGYTTGRFVDSDMALVSVEYRYPLLEKIDAFVFLDEARVFEALGEDFTTEGWHYSVGGGFRAWGRKGVSVMGLLAASKEDVQAYLELGTDF